MDSTSGVIEDLILLLGSQFRAQRLALDLDQETLARRANVSPSAVRGLEAGRGTSLRTLTRVARALGRQDWIEDFYPEPEVSPLALARAMEGVTAPQRASRKKKH